MPRIALTMHIIEGTNKMVYWELRDVRGHLLTDSVSGFDTARDAIRDAAVEMGNMMLSTPSRCLA